MDSQLSTHILSFTVARKMLVIWFIYSRILTAYVVLVYLVPIEKFQPHAALHASSGPQTQRAETSVATITQPYQPAFIQFFSIHWQQLYIYVGSGTSRGRSERSELSVGPEGAAGMTRKWVTKRRIWREGGKSIVSGDARVVVIESRGDYMVLPAGSYCLIYTSQRLYVITIQISMCEFLMR